MGNRKEYHVIKDEKGWKVIKNNSSRASARASTKEEALKKATSLSKTAKAELIIHGKDARIQNANSFGNDPHPPKDKK